MAKCAANSFIHSEEEGQRLVKNKREKRLESEIKFNVNTKINIPNTPFCAPVGSL
jgi:hypothetical protein